MKELTKKKDDLEEQNEVNQRKLKAYDEEIQLNYYCLSKYFQENRKQK